MKVNSINRQVRSQQHCEAERSGTGGRTGSPFFKDIGGKGKVSQQEPTARQATIPGWQAGEEGIPGRHASLSALGWGKGKRSSAPVRDLLIRRVEDVPA